MKPAQTILALAVLLSLSAISGQASAGGYYVDLDVFFTNNTSVEVLIEFEGDQYTVDSGESILISDQTHAQWSALGASFGTVTRVDETSRTIEVWSCPLINSDCDPDTSYDSNHAATIEIDYKVRGSNKKSKRFCKVTDLQSTLHSRTLYKAVGNGNHFVTVSNDWGFDIGIEEARYSCTVGIELNDPNI